VEKSESINNGDDQGIWVSSEDFARYAEADLDRWRQLLGRQVQHTDARWGIGIVEAVSWGSPCDHVPAYVQVRIGYQAGWSVEVHCETWHLHHHRVSVAPSIEAVMRQCLDPLLSAEEQTDCLANHARELRAQHDRKVLERRAAKK